MLTVNKQQKLNQHSKFLNISTKIYSKTEENAKNDGTEFSDIRRALPQFLAVGVKNILLFGYGLTIGFPTIVIPAIQGGEGRETTQQQHDLILSKDEISWFSVYIQMNVRSIYINNYICVYRFD